MLRLFATVAIIIASVATAAHADKLRLTIEQINALSAAISKLDSREVTIKTGSPPTEQSVQRPYNFSASLIMRLARNRAALNDVLQVYQGEMQRAFKTAAVYDGRICPDKQETCEALIKINEKARELQTTPMDIGLWIIGEAELKIEENQIPPSVITGLLPIIGEFRDSR